MIIDYICKNCGLDFTADACKRRKFCGNTCKVIYNNKNRKRFKYCLYCNKEINSKKFCNITCQTEYTYTNYIKLWKQGIEDGVVGQDQISVHIRRYLFDKFKHKCQDCGWAKVNQITNRIPLTIDHIDGNALNNKEENLKLICPNCHSLTPTYGNLNRGKGRKTRYVGVA